MISGWLVKVLVGLALAGFFVIEVGSPVAIRVQLDSAAQDAADLAAGEIGRGGTVAAARQSATEELAKSSAYIEDFTVDANRVVHLRVSKDAKSYVLDKIERMKSWYHVTLEVKSSPPPNPD